MSSANNRDMIIPVPHAHERGDRRGSTVKLTDESDKTDSDTSISQTCTVQPTRTEPTMATPRGGVWNYFMSDIRPDVMVEAELYLLTFCTGIQDAASFPDFRCFTSNQTGNTVFLMVALVMPEANGVYFIPANIGVALGFFLLGSTITGQVGHVIGPRRRWWVLLCNLVQTAMVFAVAAIQLRYGVEPKGFRTLACISLLGFSAGSQIVQSRAFAMPEITTAMATAAWIDFTVDKRMLKLSGNRPQARRLGFLLSLLAGALVGGAVFRVAGSAIALFVSAAGKMVVTLMYTCNRAEKRKTELNEV